MTKKFLVFLSLGFSLFFMGCSLKYDESVATEDINPEFVFNNTTIYRYSKKKKQAEIKAANVEQYKNSAATYSKGVEFKTFDDNGQLDTEGSCGLLYSDTSKKIYELYDSIELYSESQKAKFFADALKWNGENEQLTSARTDSVRVEKEGTIIIGSGFSASGVSGSYEFTGSVSGTIKTQENTEQRGTE